MSDAKHSFQVSLRIKGMKYDTEDIDVRLRLDDVACAIQTLPAVSRLS